MLKGCIDAAGRQGVRGWVHDTDYPAASVPLLVTVGDVLLDRVVANIDRPDIQQAGFGRGRAGFDLAFEPPLNPSRPWVVHLRSEVSGLDMPGSPVWIKASDDFDDTARAAFAASMAAFATPDELDSRISFLSEQRENLLQVRADRMVGRPTKLSGVRRALVVDGRVPKPDGDCASAAILSHMHSLQRLGFHVTFASSTMARGPALEATGIACCHSPWFSSIEEVLRRQANAYDVVYLNGIGPAAAYGALVRQHMPKARLVYGVGALQHLLWARQADVEQRPDLMVEARRLRAREIGAANSVDVVLTHSGAEASLLRQSVPPERVHAITWAIPSEPITVPFAERSGVAFIADFSRPANLDAARQLRDDIVPALRQADAAISCRLVGTGLPATFIAGHEGVTVSGHQDVPRDILASARLTVVPLRFGAGVTGQVLDSMAAGVPCVCSPIAAEGLDLPPRLSHLIVPDPATMVRQVLRLHTDQVHNARTADRCLAYIARQFSEARLDQQLRRAMLD